MVHNLISKGTIQNWVELAALVIEILAVVIIVSAIFGSLVIFVYQVARNPQASNTHYTRLKLRLSRVLLLGLEILVAATVVRTVALDATLASVAVMGLLVLVRTFLSWALVVETEGHWPWMVQPEQHD